MQSSAWHVPVTFPSFAKQAHAPAMSHSLLPSLFPPLFPPLSSPPSPLLLRSILPFSGAHVQRRVAPLKSQILTHSLSPWPPAPSSSSSGANSQQQQRKQGCLGLPCCVVEQLRGALPTIQIVSKAARTAAAGPLPTWQHRRSDAQKKLGGMPKRGEEVKRMLKSSAVPCSQ